MKQHSASERKSIRPLTSLRFAAAMLVFLYHCQPMAAIGAAYALGQAGVGFFFLLSGFILMYTYRDDFVGPLVSKKLRAFYVARIARVYPLHLVGMGLALVVLLRFGGAFWDDSDTGTKTLALVSQLLLVQAWMASANVHFGINSPAWSISAEAFFYAMFPFLAVLLLRSCANRSPRAIIAIAAVPWLVLVISACIPHPIVVWTAYVFPLVRIVDFSAGMLIAIAFMRCSGGKSSPLWGTAIELGTVAAVIITIAVSPRLPVALRYSLYLMPIWALCIWVFARGLGAGARILSQRWIVMLGEASFALYVVHWSVLQVVTHVVGWEHPIWSMLSALAISLALSGVLFQMVEQPLRRAIRSRCCGTTHGDARISATLVTPGTVTSPTQL